MHNDPMTELQARIQALWARSGIGHGRSIVLRTRRQNDGSPHVEAAGDRYDIVTTERGRETNRESGLTLEQAARWFVFRMAEGHAQKTEMDNRQAPQDASKVHHGIRDDGYSRWNWMAPTIETMDRISTALGDWTREYYATILVEAPLREYEMRNARWPLQSKGK